MTEASSTRARGPGVTFPPPLLFVAGFLVGLWLHRAAPVPVTRGGDLPLWRGIGWVLLVGAVVLTVTAMAAFRRAGTTVVPRRRASALVTTGPYRFTRNPMYLSMTTLYIAAALLGNTVWPLLLLPLVLAVLYYAVIRREERYLTEEFGESYATYRARVRRWL